MDGVRLIGIARTAFATAAVAFSLLASQTASASDISISPKERAALEMRVMQSELMVAALGCSSRDSYNAFVTRYQSELVDHGKTMQNLFKRVHGGNAFSQINAFVTRVANEASLKMINNARFCMEASAMFEALLRGDGSASLDRSRSRYHCAQIKGFGGSGCTIEARSAATSDVADDEQAR